MLPRSPIYLFSLLLFISFIVLFPGIGEITGITGKDEYYLTIRTPMHMLEGEHGWLPWLDGLPRLKKPPLIYWIGKLNFDLFGVSLTSARIIGVFFASLLVVTSAAISWLLYKDKKQALMTGLIMLGMAGIMVDGRRFLLDIPVAALTAISIYFILLWLKQQRYFYLPFSMIFLGLAFLVKGPVALIFYFPALIACTYIHSARNELSTVNWVHWSASLIIAVMLVLPWYVYLYQLYPLELTSTLSEEVKDREILTFSLSPLLNLIALALPWSIISIALVTRYIRSDKNKNFNSRSNIIFLLLWLALSLLPFFFFKSFGRYLYGCLVPLSIIISTLLAQDKGLVGLIPWFRISAIFSTFIGLILFLLVVWFREFTPSLAFSLFFSFMFIYTWWQARNPMLLAVTAILYWLSLTAIIYPRIGINAIPEGVQNIIKDEYTVLYAGPQPAMLPIAVKQGLRATSRLWTLPPEVLKNCKGFLLFSPENQLNMAKKQMADLDLNFVKIRSYRILSSRGSWARFTKEGTTLNDWKIAIRARDIDSLGTGLQLLRVTENRCSGGNV